MKKYLIASLLFLSAIAAFGQQTSYNISGTANKRITLYGIQNSTIEAGEKVIIQSFYADPSIGNCYIVKHNESTGKILTGDIKRIDLSAPTTRDELWQNARISSDLYPSLTSRGFQYDLRKDLEDESLEALQNFEKYYGFFDDEYLEDHIKSLLYKIHPLNPGDGRPGSLSVRILKLSSPDSFCLPDGTVILTTGLLSAIRSEDELIGILAHEVAHFVLDHQIRNVNKAITRQKRAEFWAGFATSITAASEVYLAAKYDYYFNGDLTWAAAVLSTSIATSVSERVGTKYTSEQDMEADNAAVMTLKLLNRDPKALSAALTRIRNYYALNGDYFELSASGTHPTLSGRIMKMGEVDPAITNDPGYDKIISFANTFNSIKEYGLNHFETTITLVNRNIEAGVGTEEDYLIKAMAIRTLAETPEKVKEALDLLALAKRINIAPSAYLYKQEGITLLRMGREKDAQDAFKAYLEVLESEINRTDYLINEIEWTKKMIHKVIFL